MKLSEAYSELGDNSFYVIAYEDGHGNIELLSETFTRISFAEIHIAAAEKQGCDLTNPQILVAKLCGIVKHQHWIDSIEG